MKSMKNTMKCLVAVFIMAMAFAVTGITAEAAVTNLKQTYDSTSSVKVSFTTVSGQKYYGVQAATDAAFTNVFYDSYTTNSTGDVTTKEVYVSGMNAGATYYVRIGHGTSSTTCKANWSAAIDVVTAPSNMSAAWVNSNDSQVAFQVYAPGANSYAFYTSQDVYLGSAAVQNVNAARTLAVNAYTPDGYYDIYPVRYNAAQTYAAVGSYKFIDASVLTTKIAKKNFGLDYVYSSSNKLSAGAAYYGTGFEVQVANVGSSKYKKSATSTGSIATVPYKQNRYLKYRVRAYVDTDAGRVYGSWSDYRAFAEMNGKYTRKYGAIYFKWTKMKGTGKIKVQVSTKENSKYKTFKTLKGSAKSITVNKYGKKKLSRSKYYYYRITPMVKIGKKYVASDYYLQQKTKTR